MDSSTSSQPIALLAACRVLDYPYHWRSLWDKRMLMAGTQPTTATSTPGTPAEKLTTAFNSKTSQLINSRCTSTGTHTAYRRLISRETDLIVVAREPSEDELKLAKDAKVEFQIKPVARDAFIFLVNAQNPLKNLTLTQVRDIYTGQIKNWKDLGGNDAAIMAYSRERNSGSLELMEKLVMQDKPIVVTRPMIIMSMVGVINRLNDDPQGIGFSLYYYEKHLAIESSDPFLRSKLNKVAPDPNRQKNEQDDDGTPVIRRKIIAINGVEPTVNTIADRSYPLLSDVYVVIRREEPSANDPQAVQHTIALRDWMLSPAGQQAVADTGYLPLK